MKFKHLVLVLTHFLGFTVLACDSSEATKTLSVDELEVPSLVLQFGTPLCVSTVGVDGDNGVWAAQVCEGPQILTSRGRLGAEDRMVLNAEFEKIAREATEDLACDYVTEFFFSISRNALSASDSTTLSGCMPKDREPAEPFTTLFLALRGLGE